MCDRVMLHNVHVWRSPEISSSYEKKLSESISKKIKKGGYLVIVEDSQIKKGDRSAEETAKYLEQFSFKKVSIKLIPGNTWYVLKLQKV